jgi:hypothetical protein
MANIHDKDADVTTLVAEYMRAHGPVPIYGIPDDPALFPDAIRKWINGPAKNDFLLSAKCAALLGKKEFAILVSSFSPDNDEVRAILAKMKKTDVIQLSDTLRVCKNSDLSCFLFEVHEAK